MANDAEGQEKQRDNRIQKAHILSFQGPTAPFAIQQGDFCIMWPSRAKGTAKGPFQGHIQFARRVFGGKKSLRLQFFLPGNRMPTGVLYKENWTYTSK